MNITLTAHVGESYSLVSIVKAHTPIEGDDRDWHRYVISQGANQIVGHRPGSAAETRRAAEELVVQLNLRRVIKKRYEK